LDQSASIDRREQDPYVGRPYPLREPLQTRRAQQDRIMKASWVAGIAVWLIHAPAADAVASPERGSGTPQRDMVLWYRQPALRWRDGLPLGNGLIGAVVFGGVAHKRIALNESTFWSGRPHDYNDPEALKYFPRIRDLVFAGKFRQAEKMVDEHFYGVPAAQQAYQSMGDLMLSFERTGEAVDYRRELDIQTGIARAVQAGPAGGRPAGGNRLRDARAIRRRGLERPGGPGGERGDRKGAAAGFGDGRAGMALCRSMRSPCHRANCSGSTRRKLQSTPLTRVH
jgi:hypothetical protein